MKLSYNEIMNDDNGKEIKILSIYKKKQDGDTHGLYHIPMTREELDVLVIQLRNLIEKI